MPAGHSPLQAKSMYFRRFPTAYATSKDVGHHGFSICVPGWLALNSGLDARLIDTTGSTSHHGRSAPPLQYHIRDTALWLKILALRIAGSADFSRAPHSGMAQTLTEVWFADTIGTFRPRRPSEPPPEQPCLHDRLAHLASRNRPLCCSAPCDRACMCREESRQSAIRRYNGRSYYRIRRWS